LAATRDLSQQALEVKRIATSDLFRRDKNCHPETSGSSHFLVGVFLGVSVPNQNRKSHKLPVFSI